MVFLSKHLKLTNIKERFIKDRIKLLDDIVKTFLVRIPFQNITSFGSVKPEDRNNPAPKQLLEPCLRGTGGLCGHHNLFMKLTLESIGYKTHSISGCFRRTGVPGSHCMTIVKIPPPLSKDKKLSDSYLVDLGCGVPLHEPILLSNLPFRRRAGGLDFRYEVLNENSIQRINENGDAIIGKKKPEFLSPQDYTIDLRPKTYEDFRPAFATVYELEKNINPIFLHMAPYLFRYLSIDDEDFEIVVIRGLDLVFVTKETRTSQSFTNYFELKPSILKYFPMVPEYEVDLALDNFSKPLPKFNAVSV